MTFSQGNRTLVTRNFARGGRLNWLPNTSATSIASIAKEDYAKFTLAEDFGDGGYPYLIKADKYFSGKLYWEYAIEGGADSYDGMKLGIANEYAPKILDGTEPFSYYYVGSAQFSAATVVGIAVDTQAGKLWLHDDGYWVNGDPYYSSGFEVAYTHSVPGPVTPAFAGVPSPGGAESYYEYSLWLRTTRAQMSYEPPYGFIPIGEM